jgi:hypothetical protein
MVIAGRVARASLWLVVITSPVLAQQEPGPANSPDPPPNHTVPGPTEKPQGVRAPLEGTARLLARRSVFFPDLAADKNALTHLQKLELATDNSIAPSMVLGDVISGGIDQATNSLKGYGQEYGGFGKRLGSALATSTTNQYFETFLLPTVLHEDPRYFALLHGTAANRVWYAITRIVVTQTDARTETVNWSGIAGPLMAEGLANIYLPSEERTVGRTFRRYGIRIGGGAAGNIAKEYWPTIFKRFQLSDSTPTPALSP